MAVLDTAVGMVVVVVVDIGVGILVGIVVALSIAVVVVALRIKPPPLLSTTLVLPRHTLLELGRG